MHASARLPAAMAAVLLLGWPTSSLRAQESRPIGETGWEMADPPGFILSPSAVTPKWTGFGAMEGGSVEVYGGGPMDLPLQSEYCGQQEITHAFDDIHPSYPTMSYFCGASFLVYILQYDTRPADERMLTPPMAVVHKVMFRSGGRPIKVGHMALARKILEGLGPGIHVSAGAKPSGGAQAPGKASAGPSSSSGAKPVRRKALTWRALAGQAVAEGSERLIRGAESKAFGVPDPAPVKAFEYAAKDSLDGAQRSALVTVKLAKDGETVEPTGILLKTLSKDGRQAERRYYKLDLKGKLRRVMIETERLDKDGNPVPGSGRSRKADPSDARVEIWLEREAEFHLKGEHRASPR